MVALITFLQKKFSPNKSKFRSADQKLDQQIKLRSRDQKLDQHNKN